MTESVKQFDTIVVGLGKTGASVVEYFVAQGKSVAAIDSRNHPPELERLQQSFPELSVYLGEFNSAVLTSAKLIVVSPGVSLMEPAIQEAMAAGVRICSDVEIFCQQVKVPIIAVTGSNGKSTVVTMLTEMIIESGLKAGLAGNIGRPVLELLNEEEPDFYVLELSSFQLEVLTSLNATAAAVLNVSPDHMDRYAGISNYADTKQRIYAGDGLMIINKDDRLVSSMIEDKRNSISYGLSQKTESDFGVSMIDGERWLCFGREKLIPYSDMKIQGPHNISNALAALALGEAIDLPMQCMLKVLQEFSGLPHRCQWLGKIDGVNWYNDSKGTNVGASCAAIEALANKDGLILIAGGDGKQADFTALANAIKNHVRAVVLIGKDASLIDTALDENSQRYFAISMEAAVSTAVELAKTGDTVLLSPACASTDMFRDYIHRGEVFSEAVQIQAGVQG